MKLKFKRLLACTAAIAAGALALSGCSAAATSPSTSTSTATGGTLTIGTLIPMDTFAVDNSAWANVAPYLQAVYDTLLHSNPDGTVVPWLAKSWSYNASKTVLTMKLRSGVKFTDGTPFTASVAAQNLLRFRAGTSPQKAYLAQLTAAKAIDPTTLEIDLSAPNPSLLSYLSQNPGLQESPKNFGVPNEKTTPVGTGPYILDAKDTVVGSSYVFTKNPHYWAPQQQHYSKLVMNVYSNTTSILNAIKGGQVNGAPLTDNSTLSQIKAAGFTINGQSLNFFGLLLFDRNGTTQKALSDVRVRQAINYAFDRKALLKAVGQGYGTVTSSIFSPASTAYEKSLDSYYSYDPAKAKKLLKEAGYSAGEITLTQPESTGFSPSAYALAKSELGAVGINVNYVNVPAASFLSDLLQAKYGSTLMQLQATPTSWQQIDLDLLPTAGWNPFHTSSDTVTKLAGTVQTGSATEAASAAKQLNEYIVKQAWFAPWYRPQQTYATDSHTSVKTQVGNAYPYLWNFVPKQ